MAYYFNLPTLTRLTMSQQAAVNEPQPIALKGGPGTGKSVVSLYRHLRKNESGEKTLLLTYTTTLVTYLKRCCSTKSPQAAQYVRRALSGAPNSLEKFNEVIVDEAQDLPESYYQRLVANHVSFGADDRQILYQDQCSSFAALSRRYHQNAIYELDKNFRSTYYIMSLAKCVFSNPRDPFISQNIINDLKQRNIGEKPTLLISNANPYLRGIK